ncbi:MAG: Holliday junction resolvase RuvX, partial [Planctomycetota bacterium]
IVLGLPLNMDGSEGGQAKAVIKFAEELKKKFDLPLHFQDERLSTFGAKEKLAAGEFTRKKTKKRLDAVAAAEILQAFLVGKKTF